MQTNSEFNGSAAFMLALVLGGCPISTDDGLGDGGVTGMVMVSSESGSTSDTSTSDTSTSDTSTTATRTTTTSEAETGDADCLHNDVWEPNASAMHPSMMTWQSVDEWTARQFLDEAYLCAGEGDWYHFDVESLGYALHFMYVRALVEDAGLCGADCDEPVLTPGPEYGMTVEIFRASDMLLLTSLSDEDGVLPLAGFGEEFGHQLLIHVASPNPKAEYSYRLSIEIRSYDGEDECEC